MIDRHKKCKVCGKYFYAIKDDKNRKQLYCSRKCYGQTLKGKKATGKQLEALKKGRGWCKGLTGIGGWKWSEKSKTKLSKSKIGKKLSLSHRQALSNAKAGKAINHLWGKNADANKRKISDALIGKPQLWNRGESHPNWQGGKTARNAKIRNSLKMKNWRRAIFNRDDYTCQVCGQRGGRLVADHIKPFSLFPELRFDLNNGRTICKECDLKSDTYGGRAIKYNKQYAN